MKQIWHARPLKGVGGLHDSFATTNTTGFQAIGSWSRYLGLRTQAEADNEQSWMSGYWQLV